MSNKESTQKDAHLPRSCVSLLGRSSPPIDYIYGSAFPIADAYKQSLSCGNRPTTVTHLFPDSM